ncbi:Uncharacterised protein [Mycobacterium tuberculosis]|nr:Uncharacterised protein [Mycobacterium tuberculosis]
MLLHQFYTVEDLVLFIARTGEDFTRTRIDDMPHSIDSNDCSYDQTIFQAQRSGAKTTFHGTFKAVQLANCGSCTRSYISLLHCIPISLTASLIPHASIRANTRITYG